MELDEQTCLRFDAAVAPLLMTDSEGEKASRVLVNALRVVWRNQSVAPLPSMPAIAFDASRGLLDAAVDKFGIDGVLQLIATHDVNEVDELVSEIARHWAGAWAADRMVRQTSGPSTGMCIGRWLRQLRSHLHWCSAHHTSCQYNSTPPADASDIYHGAVWYLGSHSALASQLSRGMPFGDALCGGMQHAAAHGLGHAEFERLVRRTAERNEDALSLAMRPSSLPLESTQFDSVLADAAGTIASSCFAGWPWALLGTLSGALHSAFHVHDFEAAPTTPPFPALCRGVRYPFVCFSLLLAYGPLRHTLGAALTDPLRPAWQERYAPSSISSRPPFTYGLLTARAIHPTRFAGRSVFRAPVLASAKTKTSPPRSARSSLLLRISPRPTPSSIIASTRA